MGPGLGAWVTSDEFSEFSLARCQNSSLHPILSVPNPPDAFADRTLHSRTKI
jgi:hypothetical protein